MPSRAMAGCRHRSASPTFGEASHPEAAIWAAALLSFAFVIGAKALEASGTPVYTIVVSCTVISCSSPARSRSARAAELWRHQVAAHGPWSLGRAGSRCSLYWHWLDGADLRAGDPAAHQQALNVTIGFLVVTAIIWCALERRRFTGPPSAL